MKSLIRFVLVVMAALLTVATLSSDAGARGGRGGGGRGGRRLGGGRGGFGGRGGGRSGDTASRKDVILDLEQRRLQEEKEARIAEARRLGAETAYDMMQETALDEDREDTSRSRRREWRSRANPG